VTRDELRDVVLTELARVAPELDPKMLRLDAPLRDQIDIDSMDFLNFIIALHDRFGVEIPEVDYGQLSTVDAVVGYIEAKLRNRRPS
jgi:acyl carrier protein